MSNTFEILNPVREFTLDWANRKEVKVRELPWREQKVAMDKIIAQIAALTQPGTGPGLAAGGMTLSVDTIIAGVKDSAETAEWLLSKTTNLAAEEILALSVTEFFTLLEAAIDLNVVGYMTGAKKAFGCIGNFVGGSAAGTAAAPTTSLPAS